MEQRAQYIGEQAVDSQDVLTQEVVRQKAVFDVQVPSDPPKPDIVCLEQTGDFPSVKDSPGESIAPQGKEHPPTHNAPTSATFFCKSKSPRHERIQIHLPKHFPNQPCWMR